MLKSTGITREVDSLGRVVLPAELRFLMGIDNRDPLEIFVDVEKYNLGGLVCGIGEGLKNINGKYVCQTCLKEIKEQVSLE